MVVLFDTNYTHPTVYTDFCYQKSITAEYHRSLLRPVYGWFACIIAYSKRIINTEDKESTDLPIRKRQGEKSLCRFVIHYQFLIIQFVLLFLLTKSITIEKLLTNSRTVHRSKWELSPVCGLSLVPLLGTSSQTALTVMWESTVIFSPGA